MNPRRTHQIDSENSVMADAWNRQTRYASADPEIIRENESLKKEKSCLKTESRLTDGIDSEWQFTVDA